MRQAITVMLAAALLGGPAGAQEPGGLKLVVLQGEGAFNDIRRRTGRDPVVEVRDDNDRPVAGAQVVFSLPETGPGGIFEGGQRTFTTTSDPNGLAAARGLRPNRTEGRFQIRVTATLGGRVGFITISQSNTLAGGAVTPGQLGGGGKKWLLVLAAGGAAGGILAATRSGSSTPAPTGPPPTILSAGGVTVGGPR
jgi:hypothetical protein